MDGLKEQDQYICCLQETPLRSKDTHRQKVKGWKKKYSMQIEKKKISGITILLSNKMDFKTKIVRRDKEEHYIMIKGSIQQEAILPITYSAPNIGGPKYIN